MGEIFMPAYDVPYSSVVIIYHRTLFLMMYLILITLHKEWPEGVGWTLRKSDVTFIQLDLTYNNLGKIVFAFI